MSETERAASTAFHSHTFLGEAHAANERRTWAVIWLCTAMMAAEIVGGWLTGSIALIADGLHMSTHAGALLLAALAYTFARRHAHDARFAFGTGKLGDLAGFTSAIILAMIAILIGYESVARIIQPASIHFRQAIPIAVMGLAVNVASAWLLAGGHPHGHAHGHGHTHGRGRDHEGAAPVATPTGEAVLEIVEDGVPPRFRLTRASGPSLSAAGAILETARPDGTRSVFAFADRDGFLESIDEVPEPHEFAADVTVEGRTTTVRFAEHDHADSASSRDNNMRAAIVHVLADATVSVAVIVGLLLARTFGWLWMDPLVGIGGALVIASWSAALVRDTGAVLLDMTPDPRMAQKVRTAIEADGDRIADLHLWRLGPGHLGAIVSVVTPSTRSEADYREKLASFPSLSHLTIEVRRAA
jgi:cation diffusion facilitator family transporter